MKRRLQQLFAQRAALVLALNAATDKALEAAAARAAAGGSNALTEDELKAEAEANTKLAGLDALIALAQAAVDREGTAAPTATVIDAGPTDQTPATRTEAARLGAVGRVVDFDGLPNLARDPMQGFRNLGEFAVAVRDACRPGHLGGAIVDKRLLAAPANFHQESGSAEGAMVPVGMRTGIWQPAFDDPVLSLLTIEPTDKPAVDVLSDEATPWGAVGVQANWRAEGVQLNPSKLATKQKQCRVHDLYAFVLATDELVEDAPRLNERLSVKVPLALSWKLVEAFIFGTGAGQPLGWASDTYGGRILQTRTTGAAVKPNDFINMFARLLVDQVDGSFWVVNRDTLPDIITNSILGNVPIWMPPTGLAGAPNGTILGRPVVFSEHAATKGTKGDVQLVNPAGYYALQRGSARQDASIHLYFDYFITAFRTMVRFGGQPFLEAAVTPAKGANTKSHFVTLNT